MSPQKKLKLRSPSVLFLMSFKQPLLPTAGFWEFEAEQRSYAMQPLSTPPEAAYPPAKLQETGPYE